MTTCEVCEGDGAAQGAEVLTCEECEGAGQMRQVVRSPLGQLVRTMPCRQCAGRGQHPRAALPRLPRPRPPPAAAQVRRRHPGGHRRRPGRAPDRPWACRRARRAGGRSLRARPRTPRRALRARRARPRRSARPPPLGGGARHDADGRDARRRRAGRGRGGPAAGHRDRAQGPWHAAPARRRARRSAPDRQRAGAARPRRGAAHPRGALPRARGRAQLRAARTFARGLRERLRRAFG